MKIETALGSLSATGNGRHSCFIVYDAFGDEAQFEYSVLFTPEEHLQNGHWLQPFEKRNGTLETYKLRQTMLCLFWEIWEGEE